MVSRLCFTLKGLFFIVFIVILVDLKHVPNCSQVGIMMNSENANSLFCDVYAAVVVTPLYPRETYLASTCVVVVFFCHPSFVYYKYPNQDFTQQNLCNRSSTFLRAKQQTRRKNNQQSTGHQWDFRLAISRDI